MNNKGFMMAEVVVVSAIVLVFMTGLYLSYNKLFSLYTTRVKYYDSSALYSLAYYRDILIREDKMNNTLSDAKTSVIDIFNNGNNSVSKLNNSDSVFMIYNKMNTISRNMLTNVNEIFFDYVDYLSSSTNFKSNYIMLMEKCVSTDECYYAYLEVYDGYET